MLSWIDTQDKENRLYYILTVVPVRIPDTVPTASMILMKIKEKEE